MSVFKKDELKIIAAIYLKGDQLQPDYISKTLGIQPTRSQLNGEVSNGKSRVVYKVGLWALIAQTNSPLVSVHLNELIKKIGKLKTPLNRMPGIEEAWIDIFIPVDEEEINNFKIEFELDNEFLKKILAMGLALRISSY